MAQQPFTPHPGMAGHPGVPHGGQPMAHGHPSNQGVPGGQQPGVSMGQQMHPGLAGPGGPQVSQGGSMMGMMHGGGPSGGGSGPTPNAHALSHLNPQPHHGQMFGGQQMPNSSESQHTFYYRSLLSSISCYASSCNIMEVRIPMQWHGYVQPSFIYWSGYSLYRLAPR